MGNKFTYNLHSHTSRCGHAQGVDFAYADMAYEAGFKEMGFSDHVMLPGHSQRGIRGDYSQLGDYLTSVSSIRYAYQGKMKIYLGFEAEWYGEETESYYRYLLSRDDFDYLLLGQHCFLEEGSFRWYSELPASERVRRYVEDLIEGMASGLFTYVCHPDQYCRWKESFGGEEKEAAYAIARASKRFGVPLEVNATYVRRKIDYWDDEVTIYPCPKFWDIVAEVGCDVVMGVDAHDPSHYACTDYDFLYDFIQKHNLNLLKDCPIQKK